jgi:alcohol dehydrogenase class IV
MGQEESFLFHFPTKLLFGRARISELASLLPAAAGRILVVTDRNVAERTPALAAVRAQLGGRRTFLFQDVRENPDMANVEDGARLARETGAELVIGVGGGSAMDAAKGIALLAANRRGLRAYLGGEAPTAPPLPVVCIPTTSGSGSEATPYAVFTDPEAPAKIGYAHPGLFPLAAIVDPELTYSMPEALVVSSGLDALSHALESYLSTLSFTLNDVLALHVADEVIRHIAPAARRDHKAMDAMAYAATLAGIVIAHGGTILPHIMGYCLTLFHGLPHGKASAVMLPAVLDFLGGRSSAPEKLERIAGLFAARGGVRAFIEELGVPTRLSAYGVQEGELEGYVRMVEFKSDLRITPAPVSRQDILGIFRSTL